MIREFFVCQCGDISHQFILTKYETRFEKELYIEIHLSDIGFWNRLKYAFWYVLGKRSKYGGGAFGEVMLDKKTTYQLIDSLQNYYTKME